MKSWKEQISSSQLMFSMACFIFGSTLLTGFVTGVTQQETWISTIAGYILSLPILVIYVLLANKYPGKSIIQITIEIFGDVLGRVISIFYIFFFFSLCFLNTNDVGDFVSGYIMPDTPVVAIYIMFVFICV